MKDMEMSNHMFYYLKNYLTFSGGIDNFPVPIDKIHYITLIDISDISTALTQKRLFIQFLIFLLEDKNLKLTKVISHFPNTIG